MILVIHIIISHTHEIRSWFRSLCTVVFHTRSGITIDHCYGIIVNRYLVWSTSAWTGIWYGILVDWYLVGFTSIPYQIPVH